MTSERVTTTPRFKRAIRWAATCGLALLLFAEQALALGLGRIEVKSRAGEPLLAEIQVISNDASELDALRARLASPETFRRIGLEAPDAVVAGLEFAVALDVRGNPVIRVTSREPVNQPALTFLVEVDWGQGRLVREYSALVDTPHTVAAGAQPVIEAPEAAPSNTIVRSPDPAGSPDVEETLGAEQVLAAEEADVPDEAAEAAVPALSTPRPAALPAAAPALADEYGPVQAGETLGEIAQQLAGNGISRDQAIVALFRANPQAFIANNLNLVRQGAVLRIPDRSEIAGLDLSEARALMREQNAAWRDMIRPAPQPDAALAGDGVATAGQATDRSASGPGAADARLEIVPPSASGGQQAGIRSGIQAGGEGEMLRQNMQQELQQNQETLAARDAEVAELKARVADLERLQAQQAQLIELKDSEMTAAQERLATSTGAAASEPETAPAGGGLPWAWIGLGLLLVAVVAWLLVRRAPRPTPRPRFDSATLAAAAPKTAPAAPVVPKDSPESAPSAPQPGPAQTPPAAQLRPTSAPAWHASTVGMAPAVSIAPVPAAPARPASETFEARTVPTARGDDLAPASSRDAGTGTDADDAGAVAHSAVDSVAGGVERIELARAYIDLGDTDTARELLREVAVSSDPASRKEAARLLEGIA